MNHSSTTDVIGLFVLFSAALFSSDVAATVGPYVAIIVASSIGASFALIRRGRTRRLAAMLFFLRVCGLAAMAAGGGAAILAWAHPSLTERALLVPVAFVIGLIGDDWGPVSRWCASFVRELVLRKHGGGQ